MSVASTCEELIFPALKTPDGAEAHLRPYGHEDAPWELVGRTPFASAPGPRTTCSLTIAASNPASSASTCSSQALLRSGEIFHEVGEAASSGVVVPGKPSIDLKVMVERSRKVSAELNAGVGFLLMVSAANQVVASGGTARTAGSTRDFLPSSARAPDHHRVRKQGAGSSKPGSTSSTMAFSISAPSL